MKTGPIKLTALCTITLLASTSTIFGSEKTENLKTPETELEAEQGDYNTLLLELFRSPDQNALLCTMAEMVCKIGQIRRRFQDASFCVRS